MPVAVCPNAETLAAFARGELSSDELAQVADHLGGCAACGGALKFVPDDDLAGLVRAAAASDTVPSVRLPDVSGLPTASQVPAGFEDHPRYRILGPIGAGGMGTVYKAEDRLMGRVIAIKVVSPHLTAKTAAVERFRKEIRAAAQLNHPGVITAHDTGEAGGSQFLVTEFIDGYSLDRLVAKKGPLPIHNACSFTRHAALGLQHAADKSMVHRDIKPQNLMVTRKGQVKILDFGIARFACEEAGDTDAPTKLPFGAGKATSAASAAVTNPNFVMGSPDYLSPEQAKNSHEVDGRSDIYSLGCTLYFLLTGKPPFHAAPTLIDKLLAHTHDAPPPVRDKRPEVPAELVAVLDKMMAKKPEDRYQTAAEAASALLAFTRADLAREPVFEVVDAVVVTPAPPASDTAPPNATLTLVEEPRPKRPKRAKKRKRKNQKWAVLAGVVAALLVVSAVVFATRGKKPAVVDPPAPTETAKANTTTPPTKDNKETKDAKDNKTDKGTKSGPPVVTPPPKTPHVLYVIPSNGVWWDDYEPVRARLVERGAKVTTAATGGTESQSRLPGGRTARPVPIDLWLRADMDLSDYAAVAFCGELVDEYRPGGGGAAAAGKVVQRMQAANKPVGAICVGQAVLVSHDLLRGRKAAFSPHTFDRYPAMRDKGGVQWERSGVVVDGKFVTAASPPDATAFADALLKLIEGK